MKTVHPESSSRVYFFKAHLDSLSSFIQNSGEKEDSEYLIVYLEDDTAGKDEYVSPFQGFLQLEGDDILKVFFRKEQSAWPVLVQIDKLVFPWK